ARHQRVGVVEVLEAGEVTHARDAGRVRVGDEAGVEAGAAVRAVGLAGGRAFVAGHEPAAGAARSGRPPAAAATAGAAARAAATAAAAGHAALGERRVPVPRVTHRRLDGAPVGDDLDAEVVEPIATAGHCPEHG